MVFSHFVRLSSDAVPSDETLVSNSGRDAELLTPHGFKGADIVLVIRTGKENNMMTFLDIQVKNRIDATMTSGLRDDARVSIVAGVNSVFNIPRPYFSLYMSLRCRGRGSVTEAVSPELSSSLTLRPGLFSSPIGLIYG